MVKPSLIQQECDGLLDSLWQRLDQWWFDRPTKANPDLLREIFDPYTLPISRKVHHKRWLNARDQHTVYWYRFLVRVPQDGTELPITWGTRSYGRSLIELTNGARVRFRTLDRKNSETVEIVYKDSKTLASDGDQLLFVNYEPSAVQSQVKEGTVDLVLVNKPNYA